MDFLILRPLPPKTGYHFFGGGLGGGGVKSFRSKGCKQWENLALSHDRRSNGNAADAKFSVGGSNPGPLTFGGGGGVKFSRPGFEPPTKETQVGCLWILLPASVGVGAGLAVSTTPCMTVLAMVADQNPSLGYGVVYSLADITQNLGLGLGPTVGTVLDQQFGFSLMCNAVGLAILCTLLCALNLLESFCFVIGPHPSESPDIRMDAAEVDDCRPSTVERRLSVFSASSVFSDPLHPMVRRSPQPSGSPAGQPSKEERRLSVFYASSVVSDPLNPMAQRSSFTNARGAIE